jgi:hypothetical protein
LVSDLLEGRRQRELFDVYDTDGVGGLRPDARHNERAVVGVDSDVEPNDEA